MVQEPSRSVQPGQQTTNDMCVSILRSARTIAFIGLSDKPERYSNKVAQYFAQKGYDIIPVNPVATIDILGLRTYKTILDIPQDIHLYIVALYRNSNDILSHVKEIEARGNFGVIWLAEGTHNREAELYAQQHNLMVISDRCMMKIDRLATETNRSQTGRAV